MVTKRKGTRGRRQELTPLEDVERAVRRLLMHDHGKTPEEMGFSSLAVLGMPPRGVDVAPYQIGIGITRPPSPSA